MNGFLDGIWHEQPGGRFLNRYHAGCGIADKFGDEFRGFQGVGVVIGLPRGGVEVAAAVANDLKLPLDFRAVKKVGHPLQPEFAIGAVDISGVSVKNPLVDAGNMPSDSEFDRMVAKALELAKQMEADLRGTEKSKLDEADWVLVVDDGAATGLTILAVVKGLKSEGLIVHVAVPIASDQAKALISEEADGFYALNVPDYFAAVGQFYDDFSQVALDEVKGYLGTGK